MQRLDRRGMQLLKSKLRLRTGLLHADAQGVAPRIIQRNVFMLLEEAHLANALGGDPAGGDIGYRSSRELQPRVRDIHFFRQDRNPHGFDFHHRLVDQRQQNVQIVNHHIVDYVDVEAARGKNAQSMHFEKQRPVQDRLNRNHGRIETFDVAHLQNPSVFLCCMEKRIGLREIHGHGLLNKDVKSHFQKPATHLRMRDGRDGNARGIRASAQFIETLQDLGLKFRRNGCGAFLILVEYSDELRAFKLTVHTCVVAPELARAHHGGTNPLRLSRRPVHFLFIPFEASFGSGTASGGNACIAIPAPSADSISFVRSKRSVRPASTARAVAPAAFICSMVGKPTTGTSKRISWPGLLTFTTTSDLPPVIRAARAMVSSVPSIASSATQARSAITTVCPMSMLAICRATPSP